MRTRIDEIELALISIKHILDHIEKGYYPEQYKTHEECLLEVVDTMRRYQKIEQIVKEWEFDHESMVDSMEKISGVVKDGNYRNN